MSKMGDQQMTKARYTLLFVSILVFHPLLQSAPLVKDGFFQTSDGVRLHYLEAGTGSAIIFEPGWTMPAEIWEPQIRYFSRTHHVVALDPRCQGESGQTTEGNFPERRTKDIREIVDHLGLSPVVLVGWSLGVRESLTYVQMFGTSTLAGLVLVDGDVWTRSDAKGLKARAQFLNNLQANRGQFTEQFVNSMYRKPQSKEYLAKVVAASLKTPTNTAVALLAELYLWNDLRPVLARIDLPVLLVVRPQHRGQVKIVRSLVPSAEAEVFEDAGHALFVDDAERFNEVLEKFVARTSQGAGK